MKRLNYVYEISAEISLSGAELLRLKALSEKHYDGLCRSAFKINNFGWGWMTCWWIGSNLPDGEPYEALMARSPEHTVTIVANTNEISTIVKICEFFDSDLHAEWFAILKDAISESERLNLGG